MSVTAPGCWPCCGRFFSIAAWSFAVDTPSVLASAVKSMPAALRRLAGLLASPVPLVVARVGAAARDAPPARAAVLAKTATRRKPRLVDHRVLL